MDSTIVVACISFLGTGLGTIGGIIASSKLTSFRLEQLEKKVEKHNSVVERTFQLEGRMNEVEHDIRDMKGRK